MRPDARAALAEGAASNVTEVTVVEAGAAVAKLIESSNGCRVVELVAGFKADVVELLSNSVGRAEVVGEAEVGRTVGSGLGNRGELGDEAAAGTMVDERGRLVAVG